MMIAFTRELKKLLKSNQQHGIHPALLPKDKGKTLCELGLVFAVRNWEYPLLLIWNEYCVIRGILFH